MEWGGRVSPKLLLKIGDFAVGSGKGVEIGGVITIVEMIAVSGEAEGRYRSK